MNPDFFPRSDAAVYGVIMNDRTSQARLGDAAAQPPYKGLPTAPVLYIKPRNTWARGGQVITLPAGESRVEVGAVLGLCMGLDATNVSPQTALDCVDACVLAADLSLPHAEYFRPAIRQKCFDGALPMRLMAACPTDIAGLVLRSYIDDVLVDERALADLLRGPAQLLADVSSFMTLRCGDVLLTGVIYQAPLAHAGSRIRIEASGAESLEFTLEQAQ